MQSHTQQRRALLVLALAIVLLIALLAGCSRDGESPLVSPLTLDGAADPPAAGPLGVRSALTFAEAMAASDSATYASYSATLSGGGTLLGKMHDGIDLLLADQVQQSLVLMGHVDVDELNTLAGDLQPRIQTLRDRCDRRQRLHLELDVDFAPGQIVNNDHVMADI